MSMAFILINLPISTRSCVTACSILLVAVLLALTVQIFNFSPVDTSLLEMPPPPASLASPSTKNNQLQNVIKLGVGYLKDPEDVYKEGNLYTATRGGRIKRLHRNGSLANWKNIDSHTSLEITATREGGLIVCNSEKDIELQQEYGYLHPSDTANNFPTKAKRL